MRLSAEVRREDNTFVATDTDVEVGPTYFYRLSAEFHGGTASFGPIEARLGPGGLSVDDIELASGAHRRYGVAVTKTVRRPPGSTS